MGFKIEDGTGTGNQAGVSNNNRLKTVSVGLSVEHFINHIKGESYNLLFSAVPTAPGDCFLYVKNTHEKDMVCEGIWLQTLSDEYHDFKLNDEGTPVGGNNIVPANLNAGSGKSAIGTFQNANDITGVSGGVTVHRIYHAASSGSQYWNFNQDIIIPKNGTLTVYAGTGTVQVNGVLVFNYHDTDI